MNQVLILQPWNEVVTKSIFRAIKNGLLYVVLRNQIASLTSYFYSGFILTAGEKSNV